MNPEIQRLTKARLKEEPWKKWGPYLSERQWGTVREDYSEQGDAWNYFSHDQSRARAYRWGEDGLGGICDERQRLCFALALWNGKDPILKERLFGLTDSESNHGEDVKEYYFYLDSTPTHSYMKYLYKYPQAEFPYRQLIECSRARGKTEMDYELLDTGVFDQNRYFDMFVEYAKASPEDVLIRISVFNRGQESAELHVLPTLWFRNQWSWQKDFVAPELRQIEDSQGVCPTGSGRFMNLYEVAQELQRPLSAIFLRGQDGQRPVYGGTEKFQADPHWQDLILFYEYFHGDNGAGLGANHQTGWTGIIARLMHMFAALSPEDILSGGKSSYPEAGSRNRRSTSTASAGAKVNAAKR